LNEFEIGVVVVIVIQAVICAAFCHAVAKAKGRDAESWAVGGFFFGLLALIAVVGMPALTPKPPAVMPPPVAQPAPPPPPPPTPIELLRPAVESTRQGEVPSQSPMRRRVTVGDGIRFAFGASMLSAFGWCCFQTYVIGSPKGAWLSPSNDSAAWLGASIALGLVLLIVALSDRR
jgi:hypothetical protein